MDKDISYISALDKELVAIISDFQLLANLNWSKDIQHEFLARAKKGDFYLPKVKYSLPDFSHKIILLQNYIAKLGALEHPAILFLKETAESYLYAYYILRGAGTKDVNEFSKILYGSPNDRLSGYNRENIEIAKYFLRVVNYYKFSVRDESLIYNSTQFKKALEKKIKQSLNLKNDVINVSIDENMTARVSAGPNNVKIRKGAHFSEVDLMQLLHHEVMIHTLTFINGRKQPVLSVMGYSSPRTTATQEGLAVFAEYINLSIELVRIKRIALRIVAIDMASKGADLIDLFKFFQSNGQNEEESYYSAMRIFRGGVAEGGVVFYKDNVYLRGMIEIEAFLKKAMHRGIIHDIDVLFAGKLTTTDVDRLHPLIDKGYVTSPVYMPQWAKNSGELAAHLAFNDLTERFKIKVKKKRKL